MKKLVLVLAVLAVMLAPQAAYAGCSCEPSPWTTKTTWSEKAVGKLEFGFKNAFFGWTELFTEPHKAYTEKTNIFSGIGKGILYGVVDEIGGILHIGTFPITQLDVKLPEGGVHIGDDATASSTSK